MRGTKMVWGRVSMMFHLTKEEFGILQADGNDATELIFQKIKSGVTYKFIYAVIFFIGKSKYANIGVE